jgi:hypothetical protein
METVVLDGVEYLKASAAAVKFKYTSDYIGQLCRAKKIDARLVGRTWFVNPESLTNYKTTKYEKITDESADATNGSTPIKIKIERREVSSPLKNKTVKSLSVTPSSAARDQGVKTRSTISFGPDTTGLIPTLNKSEDSEQVALVVKKNTTKKFLHVEPAMAKKLKINDVNKKHTNFTPSELPDVALSGKLNISDYSSPEDLSKKAVVTEAPTVPEDSPTHSKSAQDSDAHTPADINLRKPAKQKRVKGWKSSTRFKNILPFAATVISLGLALLILITTSEVEVSSLLSNSKFSLQIDRFYSLFSH